MNSLFYRALGKPSNFDDCIHFIRSKPVTKIILGLEEKGLVYENDFGVALSARVCFQTETGRDRTARIPCGVFRNSWTYSDREKVWRNANKKLDYFAMVLSKLGIEVEGMEYRFGSETGHGQLEAEAGRDDPPALKEDNDSIMAGPRPKAVINQPAYLRFANDKLILRDELAVDRTLLANERTFLSYLRSAVALAIAGVSIINFAEERWFWIFGAVCLPVAVAAAVLGIIRYRNMGHSISLVRQSFKKPFHAGAQNGAYIRSKLLDPDVQEFPVAANEKR